MKIRFRKVMYVLAIFVCAIIFSLSAISEFQLQHSRKQEEDLIEEIQNRKQETIDSKEIEPPHETETSAETEPAEETASEKKILEEYQSLYDENNDLYGWIKIEGTTIDYPVMYTPNDPNYYIDKNWKKEVCYNGVGTSVYVSGEVTDESENIIIYGHNFNGAKMFGALGAYTDPEYYEEHKYIQFDTLYEKQTYEIIGVSKSVVYYYDKDVPKNAYLFYDHIELDSEEEFMSYIEYVKQNSWYDIEESAQFGDQLITLCTCNYWTKNGRLLIVAKKI